MNFHCNNSWHVPLGENRYCYFESLSGSSGNVNDVDDIKDGVDSAEDLKKIPEQAKELARRVSNGASEYLDDPKGFLDTKVIPRLEHWLKQLEQSEGKDAVDSTIKKEIQSSLAALQDLDKERVLTEERTADYQDSRSFEELTAVSVPEIAEALQSVGEMIGEGAMKEAKGSVIVGDNQIMIITGHNLNDFDRNELDLSLLRVDLADDSASDTRSLAGCKLPPGNRLPDPLYVFNPNLSSDRGENTLPVAQGSVQEGERVYAMRSGSIEAVAMNYGQAKSILNGEEASFTTKLTPDAKNILDNGAMLIRRNPNGGRYELVGISRGALHQEDFGGYSQQTFLNQEQLSREMTKQVGNDLLDS